MEQFLARIQEVMRRWRLPMRPRSLLPIDDPWQTLEAGLAAFEPGFVITREQP